MVGKFSTIDERLAGTRWYFYMHPVVHRLYSDVVIAIRKYARGRTLDAGAGRLAYRAALLENGSQIDYVSLDIEPFHEELTVVADFCAGTDFPDSRFDTVFCSQVIEHTPDPDAFLREAFRVLKKGGHIIITAPFMFYLHGLPGDYYRYTPNGLECLVARSGFRVVEKSAAGGLIAFISMIFYVPLFHLLRFLPAWTLIPLFISVVPFSWLDRLIDTSSRFPANSIVIAKKE